MQCHIYCGCTHTILTWLKYPIVQKSDGWKVWWIGSDSSKFPYYNTFAFTTINSSKLCSIPQSFAHYRVEMLLMTAVIMVWFNKRTAVVFDESPWISINLFYCNGDIIYTLSCSNMKSNCGDVIIKLTIYFICLYHVLVQFILGVCQCLPALQD